jgi:hypothetical protein
MSDLSPAPTPTVVDADLIRYATDIAAALAGLEGREVSYGEFYVARVVIEFEKSPCGVAVVPDEHGGLGIEVLV